MRDRLPDGSRLFLDASIFIYHFTGASAECRDLLQDCASGRLHGVTSVTVIAEVAHRLMTIEAVARRLITPGNPARKLRERPDVVTSLRDYQTQVATIPAMGIEILPLTEVEVLRSGSLRDRFGLLVNDSLILATTINASLSILASADRDFERVEGLEVVGPQDLPP
jgi:predicted nucleic acid-binding protein